MNAANAASVVPAAAGVALVSVSVVAAVDTPHSLWIFIRDGGVLSLK